MLFVGIQKEKLWQGKSDKKLRWSSIRFKPDGKDFSILKITNKWKV